MNIKTLIAGTAIAVGALVAGGALYPVAPAVPAATVRTDVRSSPDEAGALAQRGLDLVQRARDQANPTLLSEAHDTLQASLALDTQSNASAFVGMAALANARHD